MVDRLLQLLQHFGLERAHVAAAVPSDWRGLATAHADRIASLSLVCPLGVDPALAAVASRAQVIHGDQGPIAERARAAVGRMPEVTLVTLAGYAGLSWSDVCAERGGEVVPALLDFVRRMEAKHSVGARPLTPGAGEVAGLAYRVQGNGPPLVLLPLALSPSQWEPLLVELGKHCCTIVLAGPHLGMVPLLEGRGQAPGYSRMLRNLVQEIGLRPGERVVEIGCGTSVLTRWLAGHTAGANPITAVDINRYLLQEAQALARAAGLQSVITFQEGNGLALPFPDGGFDVTLSLTVLEEGDADRMLAELVRVTRPGGRVAVMVRALGIPWVINVPLSPVVKTKVQTPRGFVGAQGCADAGLYRRFRQAGLTPVEMWPQLAASSQLDTPQSQFAHGAILGALTGEETQEWHAGIAQAVADGTYFIAQPFHCAVGIKPKRLGSQPIE